MAVTDVHKDPDNLTLTLTTELAATPERAWQLWSDPRQLEQWWGPPSHPATFVDHDLRTGGRVTYFMTGPEGDRYHGWWLVGTVDEPGLLEFDDGFADDDAVPNPEMPVTHNRVTITAVGAGAHMSIQATFPSLEAMEQMDAMGMVEGMTQALNQIDALL